MMAAIFNTIALIVIINIHVISGKFLISSKGEKLDLFEGVQYQLFNKDTGKQLIQAEPELSKRKSPSSYEQSPYSYKQQHSSFDDQSPQYLIFWLTTKEKQSVGKNFSAYELLFITNSEQSHKKRFLITIEKTALDNYYLLREYNPVANGSECPLMQLPDGCGVFDCRQMGDLQLWDPQLLSKSYNIDAMIKEFRLLGNITEEFDKKRTKLTVIDGEIINNPRQHTLDHFVPNFLWIDDIREKVLVEFEPEFSAPLMSRLNTQSYRIDIKVPGIRANNSQSLLRKNFHFDHYRGNRDIEHSKYYTHVSLHRITVGPLECIEYHSYANVIDRAVLPFKATAEITVNGPYGPLAQHSSKFSPHFIRWLIETKDYKLPKGVDDSDSLISSTVEGKLTTTIVIRFSYSVKTITGDPMCENI